jgi:hypothetical protein
MTTKIASIRDDPDRIKIALIDALLALRWARSEHACITAVVYFLSGIPIADKPSADGQHVITTWENDQRRDSAGTIKGRIGTLTLKRHKYRTGANLHWRTAMGAAFQAVLDCPNKARAERLALLAAKMVGGEGEIPLLWQMIDAKFLSNFAKHYKDFSERELV